jgi:hypothetical protein
MVTSMRTESKSPLGQFVSWIGNVILRLFGYSEEYRGGRDLETSEEVTAETIIVDFSSKVEEKMEGIGPLKQYMKAYSGHSQFERILESLVTLTNERVRITFEDAKERSCLGTLCLTVETTRDLQSILPADSRLLNDLRVRDLAWKQESSRFKESLIRTKIPMNDREWGIFRATGHPATQN